MIHENILENVEYKKLVLQFEKCVFKQEGWVHPFQASKIYNDVLNPWNLWYRHRNPEYLVIGQDWGNISEFEHLVINKSEKSNLTNNNLKEFIRELDVDLDDPYSYLQSGKESEHKFFFTNAIMAIRTGQKSGNSKLDLTVYRNTSDVLKELVLFLKPKYVIVCGKIAYQAIFEIFNDKDFKLPSPSKSISELVETVIGLPLNGNSRLFMTYHPAWSYGKGISKGEIIEKQMKTWKKIGEYCKSE